MTCERCAGEWIDYSLCTSARVSIPAFSFRTWNRRARRIVSRARGIVGRTHIEVKTMVLALDYTTEMTPSMGTHLRL